MMLDANRPTYLADIASKFVADFKNDQVNRSTLGPLAHYEALNDVQKSTVRDEIQKQLDSKDAFEKMVESLGGAQFLQSRVIEPGKGADTGAVAPAGTDKVLTTRVKQADKAALVADDKTPEDVFSSLEDILKDTQEDAALLTELTKDMSPADKKIMSSLMEGMQQAGDKALASAGRYELAIAKAIKIINRNPATADANKAKLIDQMSTQVRKLAADNIDMSPAGLQKMGLPPDLDPAVLKAAIMGDPDAIDKVNQAVAKQQAAQAGPDPFDLNKPQAMRDLESSNAKISQIQVLLQSHAPIEDLLIAVMMLMSEDNDEQLRLKMAEMDRARAYAAKMRNDRKVADSSDMQNKKIALQKAQEELNTRLAKGPPAAPAATAVAAAVPVATPAPVIAAAPGTTATTVSTSTTTVVSTTVATSSATAGETGSNAVSADTGVSKDTPAATSTTAAAAVATVTAGGTTATATATAPAVTTPAPTAAAPAPTAPASAAAAPTAATAASNGAAASAGAATPAAATSGAASPTIDQARAQWESENAVLQAKIDKLSAVVDAGTSNIAEMDRKLDENQSSIDKLSFQIQQLVDRRKTMFDLITKLLSTFSQMAQSVIQNIGRG